jgi:hypothetical protein
MIDRGFDNYDIVMSLLRLEPEWHSGSAVFGLRQAI